MKRLLVAILLVISYPLIGQNDFRKMNWGDSTADLKSYYPDVDWETETYQDFQVFATIDIVGGLETRVVYLFSADRLQSGIYEFKEFHTANNYYHEDFMSISTFLNKKYNMKRNENWNDTSWKGDKDNIGFALAMGHVEIEERYEDDRTIIVHQISGDGPGISHSLAYASVDFINSKREDALDDF